MDKKAFDTQQQQQAARDEQITQWNNGLNYLQSKDLLPKIGQGIDVPGGWDKNPEDAGVKSRMEIFNWMDKENKVREAAGIAPVMNVVDAYTMMKAEAAETQAQDEKTRAGDTRRAKGRMVTGNSAYVPENTQPNSIVGEGGSLNDLVTEASANL